jgi:hypothetical protein
MKAKGTRLWRRKHVLVLIIAVLVGLCVESTARLIQRSRAPEPVVPVGIGRFDERLGWALTPLAHGTSRRTGYEIDYRINSKGLRDRETTYEKPEGNFRIVLLGDSRTFGWGVPIEKHFSNLLEGYFRNVEVINMGVSGFGVDQELLYLNSEGFRYDSDLVLTYVAHYGDNRHMHAKRWGASKPRFKLVDGKLVPTNLPVVKKPDSQAPQSRIVRWLARYSAVFKILQARLRGSKSQEKQSTQKAEDEKDLQNDEFRTELYQLGEAIVYAMHEEAAKHGAAFVLVTQIKPLHEAALKKNIFSLDVLEPLSNKRFALPELSHINESANGVLAWEIAKFLKANQLVPAVHLLPAVNSGL